LAAVYYLERSGRGGRLFPALCFSFAFLIPFAELEKQRWEFSGAGGEWWPAFSIGDKEQKLEEVGNDCGDSSGVRHMRDGFVFLLKVFASCCFLNFSTLWPYLSSLPLARYTRPQFFLTKLVVSKWWGGEEKEKTFCTGTERDNVCRISRFTVLSGTVVSGIGMGSGNRDNMVGRQ